MASTRQQKVSKLLREELSLVIRRDINDPRLGFISITEVEMTHDFHTAHIYISAYGTEEEQTNSMEVLQRASGFLRGAIGRSLDMRYTPELSFHLDTSLARGAHVFKLLNEIDIPAADSPSDEKEEADDK